MSSPYAPYTLSTSPSSPLAEAEQARDLLARIAKSGYGRGIDDAPSMIDISSYIEDDEEENDSSSSSSSASSENGEQQQQQQQQPRQTRSVSYDEAEEEDSFDIQACGMPRITSRGECADAPVVLEVAPRNGGRLHNANDPLFQGLCLYSGSMTSNQREKIVSACSSNDNSIVSKETNKSSTSWVSSIASIFSR